MLLREAEVGAEVRAPMKLELFWKEELAQMLRMGVLCSTLSAQTQILHQGERPVRVPEKR